MLPDPAPHHTVQLTLPLDLSLVPPQPPPSIEQRMEPTEVWESLTSTTQAQLRRAWLHVLWEMIDDAPID